MIENEQDFMCRKWLNFEDRCANQCHMCKEMRHTRWLDLEDGQGNNEIN